MAEHQAENLRVVGSNPISNTIFYLMLVSVLIFIKHSMFTIINKIISYIEQFLNIFKNITKLSLNQTYKNNLGFFKFKFF